MSVPASEVIFTSESTGGVARTLSDKLSEPAFASIADFDAIVDACMAADVQNIPIAVDGSSASIANQAVMDTLFQGDGSVTGITRKNVIPYAAPGDDFEDVDISAPIHLRQLNTAVKPVVVLLGDSLSTYFANSIARSDMLAEILRTTLQSQIGPIQFYDRAIYGTSWTNFLGNNYNSQISWYTNASWGWYQYVQQLAPDMVVLAWGMNDNSSIKMQAIANTIQWLTNPANLPKTPTIVFATNLVPSPSQPASLDGVPGQIYRDMSAGAVRTYAKFYGYGVLDFHRKACLVRDGFDPISSAIGNTETIATVSSGSTQNITGSRSCCDWKARIYFNADGLNTSNTITMLTGAGGNDFLAIARPAANQLEFTLAAGASDQLVYANQTVSYTLPGGSGYYLVVERSNNGIVVYQDTNGNSGGYNDPIFTSKLIAMGGDYIPRITCASGNLLTQADMSYGAHRLNKPSIKNSVLWGNGQQSIGQYGGSGYNHPSGFMATHVYRPLIRGVRWCHPQSPRGSVLVPQGATTYTVTLPQNEADNQFAVAWQGVGGLLPPSYVYGKTQNSFTIAFSSALASAVYMSWQIIR